MLKKQRHQVIINKNNKVLTNSRFDSIGISDDLILANSCLIKSASSFSKEITCRQIIISQVTNGRRLKDTNTGVRQKH